MLGVVRAGPEVAREKAPSRAMSRGLLGIVDARRCVGPSPTFIPITHYRAVNRAIVLPLAHAFSRPGSKHSAPFWRPPARTGLSFGPTSGCSVHGASATN